MISSCGGDSFGDLIFTSGSVMPIGSWRHAFGVVLEHGGFLTITCSLYRYDDPANQTTSQPAEGPKVNLLDLPSDIMTQIVHQLNCADMSSLSKSCQFGSKAVKDAFGPFVVLRVGVEDIELDEERERDRIADCMIAGERFETPKVEEIYERHYGWRRMLLARSRCLEEAKVLDGSEPNELVNDLHDIAGIQIIFMPNSNSRGGAGVNVHHLRTMMGKLNGAGLLEKVVSIYLDGRKIIYARHTPPPSDESEESENDDEDAAFVPWVVNHNTERSRLLLATSVDDSLAHMIKACSNLDQLSLVGVAITSTAASLLAGLPISDLSLKALRFNRIPEIIPMSKVIELVGSMESLNALAVVGSKPDSNELGYPMHSEHCDWFGMLKTSFPNLNFLKMNHLVTKSREPLDVGKWRCRETIKELHLSSSILYEVDIESFLTTDQLWYINLSGTRRSDAWKNELVERLQKELEEGRLVSTFVL
jgi:hypothetical protein